MIDRLALVAEAARGIRHQSFALRRAHALAQVGFFGQAIIALAAFRGVERNDVIALLERRHARGRFPRRSPRLHGPECSGTGPRNPARHRVGIGMTETGRLDLDEHLAVPRPLEVDLDDLERFLSFECDSGARFHDEGLTRTFSLTYTFSPVPASARFCENIWASQHRAPSFREFCADTWRWGAGSGDRRRGPRSWRRR